MYIFFRIYYLTCLVLLFRFFTNYAFILVWIAGQTILAGWCIWDSGWRHKRKFWSLEYEKGSFHCYKVSREGCITEAIYCRGIGRAKGSLQYSAQIPWIFSKWELILQLHILSYKLYVITREIIFCSISILVADCI